MGKKLLYLGASLMALPFLVKFGTMMYARYIGAAPDLMGAEFSGISVLLLLFVPGVALVIVGGVLFLLKV